MDLEWYSPLLSLGYRSIQIDYRQTFFLRTIYCNYRYRIVLPEELISITETDLWECLQKISRYRYIFSLEFQLIGITDTDFGLKTNWFCSHLGYNRTFDGGGSRVGGMRGSATAWCPFARDRQALHRQRNVTPLVLLKEDHSCAAFAWQYGDAPRMANDIGLSRKKRTRTVPPHHRPLHQRLPPIKSIPKQSAPSKLSECMSILALSMHWNQLPLPKVNSQCRMKMQSFNLMVNCSCYPGPNLQELSEEHLAWHMTLFSANHVQRGFLLLLQTGDQSTANVKSIWKENQSKEIEIRQLLGKVSRPRYANPDIETKTYRVGQETAKDPANESSRSQLRSVTECPPLWFHQNYILGAFHREEKEWPNPDNLLNPQLVDPLFVSQFAALLQGCLCMWVWEWRSVLARAWN